MNSPHRRLESANQPDARVTRTSQAKSTRAESTKDEKDANDSLPWVDCWWNQLHTTAGAEQCSHCDVLAGRQCWGIEQSCSVSLMEFKDFDWILTWSFISSYRSLGGRITTDINEMTHLVMTKPSRTIKFLQSLCVAKYIVKSSWLEESVKAGYFQPEDNFWLAELEGNFKCNVPAVVMSPIRKKLFHNRVFFITPSVIPGPSWVV